MEGRMSKSAFTILSLVCAAVCAAPAFAQVSFSVLDRDLDQQFRGIAQGGIPANQIGLRRNIDTRLSQLRSQVTIALSRRWITARQAMRLNRQMDMIQAMETRSLRKGLTVAEAQDLRDRIRTMQLNINNEIATTGRFNRREAASPVANLENQRLYVQSRIDEGVRLGRLSPAEVAQLRAELNRITLEETTARGLSPEQQLRLHRELSGLSDRVNRFM
jgi:hypothetical protein